MSDETPEPRSRARHALRLLAEIAAFAVIALLAIGLFGRLRGPDLPAEAPPFTLPDLDGRPVALADFAGRPVIVNFWATWCAPCRFEIPSFSAFARDNPDIAVLGLAADGTAEHLRAAAVDLGVDYPILRADRATLAAYGVDVYPTTVVIDAAGRVHSTHAGLMLGPHLWAATRGLDRR